MYLRDVIMTNRDVAQRRMWHRVKSRTGVAQNVARRCKKACYCVLYGYKWSESIPCSLFSTVQVVGSSSLYGHEQ